MRIESNAGSGFIRFHGEHDADRLDDGVNLGPSQQPIAAVEWGRACRRADLHRSAAPQMAWPELDCPSGRCDCRNLRRMRWSLWRERRQQPTCESRHHNRKL